MKILRFMRLLSLVSVFFLAGVESIHAKPMAPKKYPPAEHQSQSKIKPYRFTDRELRELLLASNRVDQDMSGSGNNCAYYAILSQSNPKNFGGQALSPMGYAHADANSYVQILRQKTNTPKGIMFETGSIQKVANYCKRPVMVISQEFTQIECVFPNEPVELAVSPLDFDENLHEWLQEYLGNNSSEISRVLGFLERLLPLHVDTSKATVRSLIIDLLKNPKVIGLLHANGNHFHALQPTRTPAN
ncbi:MAG: hypothetical protein LBI56_01730 [Puniceicoccales bacterium]|jgi:hypothetical protein|nr:hypothetical protein [Puniceicoccales bacterium]